MAVVSPKRRMRAGTTNLCCRPFKENACGKYIDQPWFGFVIIAAILGGVASVLSTSILHEGEALRSHLSEFISIVNASAAGKRLDNTARSFQPIMTPFIRYIYLTRIMSVLIITGAVCSGIGSLLIWFGSSKKWKKATAITLLIISFFCHIGLVCIFLKYYFGNGDVMDNITSCIDTGIGEACFSTEYKDICEKVLLTIETPLNCSKMQGSRGKNYYFPRVEAGLNSSSASDASCMEKAQGMLARGMPVQYGLTALVVGVILVIEILLILYACYGNFEEYETVAKDDNDKGGKDDKTPSVATAKPVNGQDNTIPIKKETNV